MKSGLRRDIVWGFAAAAAAVVLVATTGTTAMAAPPGTGAAAGGTSAQPADRTPSIPAGAAAPKTALQNQAVELWEWRNLNSGKCLGVNGGSMANGTAILQWDCNGNADQYWYATSLGNGYYYRMRNAANRNKCLGVPGGSNGSGLQLLIWDCNGNADQLWTWGFTSVEGCYKLQNYKTRKIAGVAGGSLANGAAVVQWEYEGHLDQIWC